MPGRHVNDQQVRLYMRLRRTRPQTTAAAMAGVSVATGRRIERHPRPPSSRREGRDYRTRPDPLEGLWDEEIVSMLEAAPALRPITILRELARRHPETRQCLAEAPTGGVPALLSNNARRRKHRREARPSCRAADERPTAGRPRLSFAAKPKGE